jgi:small-conductance mechanosensitive channel
MGDTGAALANALGTALIQNVITVGTFVPRLVVAILILLLGYLIARLLGRVAEALLARLGLDRLADQAGLTEDVARVGLQLRPSHVVGRFTLIVVLIAALVQAVDVLGLEPLSQTLRGVLQFAPRLLLALAILLGGAVGGEILARTTSAAMRRAGVLYHTLAGSLVRVLVLFLTLLLALQQLTIEAVFLFQVVLILLGGTALAVAIAFGWGARTLAENVAGGRYVEQNFGEGDSITISSDGMAPVAGTIEELGLTSTTIRTSDGRRVVVPNGVFARAVVQAELPPPDAAPTSAPPGSPAPPPARPGPPE